METIKLTKEYTFEEVRDDIKTRCELAKEAAQEVADGLISLSSSLSLKALNLSNIKDNLHLLRREIFMLDQMLDVTVGLVDAVQQAATPPAAGNEDEADEQAG
jgi:hypothetical protein